MKDKTMELLSSIDPITSRIHFDSILAGQWLWIEQYGDDLFTLLHDLNLPPMVPMPKKPRKRRVDAVEEDEPAKKTRTTAALTAQRAVPSPVPKRPPFVPSMVGQQWSRTTPAGTPSVFTSYVWPPRAGNGGGDVANGRKDVDWLFKARRVRHAVRFECLKSFYSHRSADVSHRMTTTRSPIYESP